MTWGARPPGKRQGPATAARRSFQGSLRGLATKDGAASAAVGARSLGEDRAHSSCGALQPSKEFPMRRLLRLLVLSVLGVAGGLLLGLGVLWWQAPRMDRASEEPPASAPGPGGARWGVRTLATGLDAPWALAILPGGEALVSERGGRLWRRSADGALRPVSGVPAAVVGG